MNTTLTPLAASIERAQAALDRKAADAHARPREMQAALRASQAPAKTLAQPPAQVHKAAQRAAQLNAAVIEMYRRGATVRAIAMAVGRTPGAVYIRLHKLRKEGAL